MDEPYQDNKKRRIILEEGALVILHPDGPAGGFPMAVCVDRMSDGLHWFLGSCDPIGRGEDMIVESPVHEDARYVTRAKVAACSTGTFALRLNTLWERVQQRSFVRIFAHGLQVRVVRPTAPPPEPIPNQEPEPDESTAMNAPIEHESVHDLVDISAGGIRFQSNDDYEHDEQVVCHFELPGSYCFVLPARIVRPGRDGFASAHKPSVAVEFVGLDENTRSQLLRWVYREQVRRHRDESRRDSSRN